MKLFEVHVLAFITLIASSLASPTGNSPCRPVPASNRTPDDVADEGANPVQWPCGPSSQCREVDGSAICSCLPHYVGNPPNCQPECVYDKDCPSDKGCFNNRCADRCRFCAENAECNVQNHSSKCACLDGYMGDPYYFCSLMDGGGRVARGTLKDRLLASQG